MKSLFLLLLAIPFFANAQDIKTIAGTGIAGYTNDGEAAIDAEFNGPTRAKFDATGNLYIADENNNVIRKINTSGIITTVAGNVRTSSNCGYSGDGGPATAAELCLPSDVAFDVAGNVYIAEFGNSVIRKVNSAGIITTIAGEGISGLGDGGPATAAQLYDPIGLTFDALGNLYFSDNGNHRVRKIDTLGIITTIAGTGVSGFSGDNGPATAAKMIYPGYIDFSPIGELYIADYFNHRIRKIDTFGIITTVAGTGSEGYTGDGESATAAELYTPMGVFFDKEGDYFISELFGNTIRKVDVAGIITTIAGTGVAGYGGDGGSATAAELNNYSVCSAIDASGNVYIADYTNNRIRRVTYNGTGVNNVVNTQSKINIYPNPANNEITLKDANKIESIEIVNMLGQTTIKQTYTNTEKANIDVGTLLPGIYFVKVNGVYGGKFVKH